MKNSNKFIVFCSFLMIGVFVADTIFAAPNKRATRTKKSSKKTSVQSASQIVETGSSDTVNDERAGNTTARARGNTTVTTTTTTPVDEETAAQLLASNLLQCVNEACYGDIAYEKCVRTGVVDTYIHGNATCLTLYNKEKSDIVKIKAKNLVNAKIKSYFADACSGAGGKVSNDSCKIQVCYFAKGGGEKRKQCKDIAVGKSFTCSYTEFGLQPEDMEYKEEMTSEQMGMIINAGINAFTGLTQVGLSVADSVIASNELKKKSNIKGKTCKGEYIVGSEHIGTIFCKETWELNNKCKSKNTSKDTSNDTSKDTSPDTSKDTSPGVICVQDEYGNKYEKKNTIEDYNSHLIGLTNCNSLKSAKDGTKCFVELSEHTELAVKEKEAELYKKFTNFSNLKLKDAMNSVAIQGVVTDYSADVRKNVAPDQKNCGVYIGQFGGFYYYPGYPATQTTTPQTCEQVAQEKYSGKVHLDHCKQTNQGRCYCKSNENDCENATWNENTGGWWAAGKMNSEYFAPTTYKGASSDDGPEITFVGDSQFDLKTRAMQTALENLSTNNYDSAKETYNSMQKKVSEEKTKISSLEERKSTGLQNAIATGASTLVQSGTSLSTAIVAANSNTGTMIGSCYIGDPENGGNLFSTEGAAKKLTWGSL